MNCFLCGNEIGWLRSTIDQQYCSVEHRKEARLASSQVLREEEEEYGQELWAVSRQKAAERAKASTNQTIWVLAFMSVAAILTMMVSSSGQQGGSALPGVSLDPGHQYGIVTRAGNFIGKVINDQAPVTLHQDFSGNLSGWKTAGIGSGLGVDDPHDWKHPSNPSLAAPSLSLPSLRIWARSTSMKNYQMEFQGQIENRSLSWAFRATDAANYYAAKVFIDRPGPLPNAGLIHYAMVNGRETDRVQLPLPITLSRGEAYRVRVSVKDDHFFTYLDGQMISSWTDNKLTRGGVGFFNDNADRQKVAWVDLSERDSFLGQMLAHFSLFLLPGTAGFPAP